MRKQGKNNRCILQKNKQSESACEPFNTLNNNNKNK